MRRLLRYIGRSLLIALAVLLVLAIGLVAYEYAAARPAVEERRLADQGRALYMQHCAACHGVDLLGHGYLDAPPLWKWGFAFYFFTMPKDMEQWLAGLIGKGRRLMPPYQTLMNPEQRAALAAFLRQVNTRGDVLFAPRE